MAVILAPLFAEPIHPQNWIRPGSGAGANDYRITAGYDSVDLVNGGKHRATDVGDGSTHNPVLAPATCLARGRRHFDSALGVEFDLEDGWRLEAWHLSRTLPVIVAAGKSTTGAWMSVSVGALVGRTGNTGGRLADGRPMLHHTHIVLLRNGQPVDVAPYLFGRVIPTSLQGGKVATTDLFSDISKSTHRAAINRLAKRGIFATGGTGKFYPKAGITREEIASLLARVLEEKE